MEFSIKHDHNHPPKVRIRTLTILSILCIWIANIPGSASEFESCSIVAGNAEGQNQNHGQGQGVQPGTANLLNPPISGGSVPTPKPFDPASHHPILTCLIRILHPDLDIENLTLNSNLPVPLESIARLRLECNDVLFFESAIGSRQLASLPALHELWIEKCKLKQLGSESLMGLRHLRRLTLNTGNSDWAARSLEISAAAFSAVPSLRHLDLGFNHMWTIPDRTLCSLPALQTLNLTHNLLSEVNDLGLPRSSNLPPQSQEPIASSMSSPCLGDLKSLDLSHNSLRDLGSRRFSRLRRLTDLRLNHNELEDLHEEALQGLTSLHDLNMSSNRLTRLPAKLFANCCKVLNKLDLHNNSMTVVPVGLLENLQHLQTLDLSSNGLDRAWLEGNPSPFKGLIRLIVLHLQGNQINGLTATTFLDLYTLQVLDLGGNGISTIEDGTFSPMANLHSLNLSRNKIHSVGLNMLNGLYVLHKLILDYNDLVRIEVGAFRNVTSLSDLGLVGNQFTEVPPALKGLQLLTTLDLGENRIRILSNDSFAGMGSMYGIRLVDNDLKIIPPGLCDPLAQLRVFNAGQNKIEGIAPTAFLGCPLLRVLRLDSNALETFPAKLGAELPALLWLNIGKNKIRRMEYGALPPRLEWLDVSRNGLEELAGLAGKNPEHGLRLRVMDASHNAITHLDAGSIPSSLENFTVNHNQISKLAPETFSRAGNLRRVELIGNQLEGIPLSALRLPVTPVTRAVPEFLLGGNPFLCDCEMEWLTQLGSQLSATRQYPTVLDLDAIVCRLPYSRAAQTSYIALPDMRSTDFLCPYTSHCFNLCQCCDFDACDCAMTCPGNCTCYHDDNWIANVVDCAGAGHGSIPSTLPMDSTIVNLDGNQIPLLRSHSFIGRKNLKILYLNSSGIEVISNKSFNGLQSIQTLHLEGNALSRLRGFEFDGLKLLRELYLQDNRIELLSNVTFLGLKSLEILRLDGNRLRVFAVWQLSMNPYLVEIGLGRNAWDCDCAYLHQLYGWVADNSKKVIDLPSVRCVWNTTKEVGPHLLDYNTTCEGSWALIQGGFEDFDLGKAAPWLIGGAAAVLCLILIAVLLSLFREEIRIAIYGRFGLRLCARGHAQDQDEDKSYDAYFLYSQKDEEFINSRVADELETNDNYRLCLHYRDLLSEGGDLRDVMVGALDSAKCVVVWLSRNLLQAEWGSTEYTAGYVAVMKAAAAAGNSKSVIVVHIDDLPEAELDAAGWPQLGRRSRSGHTHLKWMDSKFWRKFKYSLPDPSNHYHSNITSHTTTSSASSGRERGRTAAKYYGHSDRPNGGNDGQRSWNFGTSHHGLPASFVAVPPSYAHAHGLGHGHNGLPHVPPARGMESVSPPLSNRTTTGTDSTVSTLDQDYDGSGGHGSHVIPAFLFQPNAKSPVPLGNFGRGVASATDSYLSSPEAAEHVYSTLDPPSPTTTAHAQTTYSPNQWHPPHPAKQKVIGVKKNGNGATGKEGQYSGAGGASIVQTYLV